MENMWKKTLDLLKKLDFILSKEQKKYSLLVLVMALVSAALEMLGVSIILPLLDAFLTPDTLIDKAYIKPFAQLFHLTSAKQIVVFICIAIIILYIMKNGYNTFYSWVSSKFSCKISRELSVRILNIYMKQGYSFFSQNNSARLLRGMGGDVESVYTIIVQVFSMVSKMLMMGCIILVMIVVAPFLSLFMLALIVFCFVITQLIFQKPMRKYGEISRYYKYKSSQTSLEAIQGSKEVLVKNRQNYFIEKYEKSVIEGNKADVKVSFATATPAYMIEAICITGLMTIVAFQMLQSNNSSTLLTQISVLAVGAFRILPALGAILSSVNMITYCTPALAATYDNIHLVKDLEKNEVRVERKKYACEMKKFVDEIQLDHIVFYYQNSDGRNENVIDDLSLTIKKGSSIAFIGASGAGKTTLSDIILGLYKPQKGKVLMDGIDIENLGEGWSHIIGYVPQSIYMTDTTIRQNIAFGISEDEIDDSKVWKALEMAQLKETVENLPGKLNTSVGEWGVQFSGGQRQRVAIARALYGEPDILVLDEATAALDTATETAVMEAIDALQGVKTLIIVAHRLTTIRNCDAIYRIEGGKAVPVDKSEIFVNESFEK